MLLGLDYSRGRPSGAAIRAAGYRFVVRYLENGLGGGRVNITAAEFADLRSAGIDVALVWESQAQRATQGRAAGAADAQAADAAAKAIGAASWPVYFAVDFDLGDYAAASTDPLAKLGPVGSYFGGALSVLPLNRVGVYGGYWAVRRVRDAGLAALSWQTLAWSGANLDPRINLLQRIGSVTIAGTACDVNEQHTDYYGQGPASSPTPITTEDDVFFVRNSAGDTLCIFGGRMVAAVDGSQPPAGAVVWTVGDTEYASFSAKETEAAATAAALAALPAKLDAVQAALKAAGGGTTGGGLTADQLSAAVRDGLDGVTAAAVLHKPEGN